MKKKYSIWVLIIALAFLELMLTGQKSQAQTNTFGSIVYSVTTNYIVVGPGPTYSNVQVVLNGSFFTNQVIVQPTQKFLSITNVYPNETNVFGLYLQAPNLLTVDGVTNLILIGYATNIYSTTGSTNYTITPPSATIPFPQYMSVFQPYTNVNGYNVQ